MAMDNKDVISELNDLIETCEDGMKGFRTAADSVKSPEARTFFNDRIRLIERGEQELKDEVRRLGGDPENRGSVSGALHRGWINIKSAITGKDDAAILAEAERGEDAAVKNYENALKKDLPPDVRRMVQRQYEGVVQNRDRVRTLKNIVEGGGGMRREAERGAPPPV
jgi:uncharacterized protein (TIGR02284 family)